MSQQHVLAEHAEVGGVYLTKQNQEVEIIAFDKTNKLVHYKVIASGLVGKKMPFTYQLVPVGPQSVESASAPSEEPENVVEEAVVDVASQPAAVVRASAPAASVPSVQKPPVTQAKAQKSSKSVAAPVVSTPVKKKCGPKKRELSPREQEITAQIDALKAELKSLRPKKGVAEVITGVPVIDRDPVFAAKVVVGIPMQEYMDKLGTKVGWTALRRAMTDAVSGKGTATMSNNIIIIKA